MSNRLCVFKSSANMINTFKESNGVFTISTQTSAVCQKSLNNPSPNQARSPKEVKIRRRHLQKEFKSQSRFYFLQSSVNDGAAEARVMEST